MNKNDVIDSILVTLFAISVVLGVVYAHNLSGMPKEKNPDDLIHRPSRVSLNS